MVLTDTEPSIMPVASNSPTLDLALENSTKNDVPTSGSSTPTTNELPSEDDDKNDVVSTPAPAASASSTEESSGSGNENALDQEPSGAASADSTTGIHEADFGVLAVAPLRNVVHLSPVINLPTVTHPVEHQDPNLMLDLLLSGFQQMTLQAVVLNEAVNRMNETITATNAFVQQLQRGQDELVNEVTGVRVTQDQTLDEIQRFGDRLTNLEQMVNQMSEDQRAFYEELNHRIRERERLEREREEQGAALVIRDPGHLNVQRWRRVLQNFLAMDRFSQFLVVLGVIAMSYFSYRVAIWAYPYIVETVLTISSQFTNLMGIARGYLANVNWNDFIIGFANMGGPDGFNFQQFMNDPIALAMNGGVFGRNVFIFIITLLQIIRTRYGDNYN